MDKFLLALAFSLLAVSRAGNGYEPGKIWTMDHYRDAACTGAVASTWELTMVRSRCWQLVNESLYFGMSCEGEAQVQVAMYTDDRCRTLSEDPKPLLLPGLYSQEDANGFILEGRCTVRHDEPNQASKLPIPVDKSTFPAFQCDLKVESVAASSSSSSAAAATPTPVPPPTPAPVVVDVGLTVEGVDFGVLQENETLKAGFEAAMKTAVAPEFGVPTSNVDVTLSQGSVVVEASVTLEAGSAFAEASDLRTKLQAAVVERAQAVPNIASATTGSISAAVNNLGTKPSAPSPNTDSAGHLALAAAPLIALIMAVF